MVQGQKRFRSPSQEIHHQKVLHNSCHRCGCCKMTVPLFCGYRHPLPVAARREGGCGKRSRRLCFPAKSPTLLTPEEAGILDAEPHPAPKTSFTPSGIQRLVNPGVTVVPGNGCEGILSLVRECPIPFVIDSKCMLAFIDIDS